MQIKADYTPKVWARFKGIDKVSGALWYEGESGQRYKIFHENRRWIARQYPSNHTVNIMLLGEIEPPPMESIECEFFIKYLDGSYR